MAQVSNSISPVSISGSNSSLLGLSGNILTGISTGTSTSTVTTPYYNTNTIYFPTESEVNFPRPLIYDFGDGDGLTFLHEIAVIKVTRNDNMKIISSKMIKIFWVETHSQESIEFAASKDPEVAKFEPNEIIIKTLRTIKL